MPGEPKIAFLIAAHDEPLRLRRLVCALAAPWARFFIHIDRKVALEPFTRALMGVADVTFVKRRVRVHWGGWSQVEATLRMMRGAIVRDGTLMRFVLLSGACYPLRSNEALRDFLFAGDSEHLNVVPMPDLEHDKPLSRLTRWYFEGGLRGKSLKARALRLANDALRVLPPRSLRGLAPYAGSSWWVLTRAGVETVLRRVETDRHFVSFFRHSLCPDESFFQSALADSPLAHRIADNLTYADWLDGSKKPGQMTGAHLDLLLGGDGPPFFARKFSGDDEHLFDRIDAARRECPTQVPRLRRAVLERSY
jgi:hypothetical protein